MIIKGKTMKKYAIPLAIGLAVGLISMVFTYFNLLATLERQAYDMRLMLRDEQQPAPNVLIIGITDDCLEELGRWPWDREIHAQLLDRLNQGQPKAIGMDIIFSEPAQRQEMDQALVAATARSVPVVYPLVAPPAVSDIPGFLRPMTVSKPFPQLMEVGKAGFINVTPDVDGVVRRALLWMEYEGWPIASFDMVLWALSQDLTVDQLYELLDQQFAPGVKELQLGNFAFPLDGGGRTLIDYVGGPGSFPVLPYHLVLEGLYPPELFQDTIILVGSYTHGISDYYFTPYAKDNPMFGVEVHAHIIHTLTQAGPISSLSLKGTLALVFSLALLSALVYQRLRPLLGFGALLVFMAVFYLITLQLFAGKSFYVETVYPLLALSGSYFTTLGYNFLVEQREKQRVTRIFGRYVAPQVVSEILNVGEENIKLGGTRRRITLLFIDVRGFTPLSEKLSPEEVVGVLNQYFEIVTKCIFENNGTIDKFMGDAAMALFNAPLDLEDHALWAVKAAQCITSQGAALQKKVQENWGVTLNFGIGINTGECVVGNIGAENRMDYTAIGDAVNLAARLESNAKAGQVLVSQSVYDEVAGRLPLEHIGDITVKGKSQPITVYQLAK